MREIKFRGSPIEDYADLKWFEGGIYLNQDDRLAYINTDYSGVVPVHWDSVGQFTGLKDRNGVEIYEGDIYHQGDPEIIYLVVWHDTGLQGKQIRSSNYAGLSYWKDRIEVIGNIYENPELLTEK
ncbi:YopX family protein [Bacillus sp. 179-C3.3 HS]|uniref:YopX family protein n=1 Tax=Bacillus sp. 179-C3.3 HS TaxID=3232162 RepID=UPI00399F842F